VQDIPFLETSAKDSVNVDEAFLTMARQIKNKQTNKSLGEGNQQPTIKVTGGEKVGRRGCCG
jgi:Ras-related protein Rab-1A